MAITRNITAADGVYTGTDTTLAFTIYVPGTTQAQIDGATATKQNITGYTFLYELRLNRDASPPPILVKTNGSGITITDAPNGALSVALARVDWLTAEPGEYWHELARTNAGNYTIETDGSFTLLRGIR